MDDEIKPLDCSDLQEFDQTRFKRLTSEGLQSINLDDLTTLDDLPTLTE